MFCRITEIMSAEHLDRSGTHQCSFLKVKLTIRDTSSAGFVKRRHLTMEKRNRPAAPPECLSNTYLMARVVRGNLSAASHGACSGRNLSDGPVYIYIYTHLYTHDSLASRIILLWLLGKNSCAVSCRHQVGATREQFFKSCAAPYYSSALSTFTTK